MELYSKILTQTDVVVRLSFATAAMKEHFRPEEGAQSLDFQVMDNNSRVWTFRLYIRKNNGHPKPVVTKGWLDFVRHKRLGAGDKVIFLVYENGDGIRIRVQRKIHLLGQDHWADI
ncbi:hypothetical protein PTKIN_Ptkin10aG0139900 [Pterospermum kingtungense]